MLKTILAFLFALVLAIGGGAASLAYVLNDTFGAGAISFGPWTAFRSIGSADADPYSRARIAREGLLALGEGEGLAFVAERDSEGSRLRFDCTYRIEGSLPQARFWTMFVEERDFAGPTPSRTVNAIQSRAVVRQPDNSLVVTVSRHVAPGNWMRVDGSGAMRIVTTMYDFSLSAQSGEIGTTMPRIIQAGCDE